MKAAKSRRGSREKVLERNDEYSEMHNSTFHLFTKGEVDKSFYW